MSSEKTHQMQKSKQATAEGRKHFKAGNYLAASDSFTIAVNNMPRNIRAWLGLGMSSVHLNKWSIAEKSFSAAIQIRPDNLTFLRDVFPLCIQKRKPNLLVRFGIQYLEMYPEDEKTRQLFDWDKESALKSPLAVVACSGNYKQHQKTLQENGFKAVQFPQELLSAMLSDRHTLDQIVYHYLRAINPTMLILSTKDDWTISLAKACLEQGILCIQLACNLLENVDSNVVHSISTEDELLSYLQNFSSISARNSSSQPLIRINILSKDVCAYSLRSVGTPQSNLEFATCFYWMMEMNLPFTSRAFHLHFIDSTPEDIASFEKRQFPFSYSFSSQEAPDCFVQILGDTTILTLTDIKSFVNFIEHSNFAQLKRLQPPALRKRVHGSYLLPGFIRIGKATAESLHKYITQHIDLNSSHSLFDWGCGSGRVLVFLRELTKHTNCQLYGTDIDEEAINWCKQNLDIATFHPNGANPPLPFTDDSFDVVTANSIFTHLPEEMQFDWLKELKRITKVGAYLFLTTHGSRYQKELDGNGFVYYSHRGGADGLPDWYQVAFHQDTYVYEKWGEYFEIIEIVPLFCDGAPNQDLVICRNVG